MMKTSLKLALLTSMVMAATTSAQAARLQLISGTTSGQTETTLSGASADTQVFGGTVTDLSGTAELLGFDAGSATGTLDSGAVSAGQDWSRLVTLDASGTTTTFTLDAATSLSLDGAMSPAVAYGGTLRLDGLLQVVGDAGEADGQAVQVRLQLDALTLGSLDAAPHLVLTVSDASAGVLARFDGGTPGAVETMDVSFASAVGQTLALTLGWSSAALWPAGSLPGGAQTLEQASHLSGLMSVSAVPEPQTALLLVAGLGLVGLSSRRVGGTARQ